jgi:hypothetical protein
MIRAIFTVIFLALAAGMFGMFLGHMFFGVSLSHATLAFVALIAATVVAGLALNKLTIGTWTRPISPERDAELKADLDARFKRMRRVQFIGFVAVVPIVLALVFLGYPDLAKKIASPVVIAVIVMVAFVVSWRKRSA